MKTLSRIAAVREAVSQARRNGQQIGFVPTMGNLHEGHQRLVEYVRERCDYVVTSIFVNPLQFGPQEDLARYPRTPEADAERLLTSGCDLLFSPEIAELYPHGMQDQTRVSVPVVSEGLCGASRPGHFEGVATVVTKLLNIVQPDLAAFGEKDYQQLAVIRRLVADLNLPVDIHGVPTVRAADGLALSSRNGYLDAAQRAQAPGLYAALTTAATAIEGGAAIEDTLEHARKQLRHSGFELDYMELRAADSLSHTLTGIHRGVLLVAARLGTTRLIDNRLCTLPITS